MFKKFLIASLLFSSPCYAGLITHTDYTSGNAITASGQNSNENTIVTVINGNLDTNNISPTAAIVGTQLSAAAAIAATQLATNVQSTITYVNTFGPYRRPELEWVNGKTVNVSSNTGTTNQTCVQFPNENRCVTENVLSTNVNRQCILTSVASLTGTKDSGLRSGYALTNNTWYSFYAVKATDVSTDFVIVADTITPSLANYATLNTAYGTNGWVYLGVLPYGNWVNNQNSLVNFEQAGNFIVLKGSMTSTGTLIAAVDGIALSSATLGSSNCRWTYATGFDISSHQVPSSLFVGTLDIVGPRIGLGQVVGATSITQVADTGSFNYNLYSSSAAVMIHQMSFDNVLLSKSLQFTDGGGVWTDCMINLKAYTDRALNGFLGSPF